ncbi:MAG: 2-oxoglutarate dehydrogenase complex dihydrolipoyllysine-residue succinyltransferase [Chitinophagales bacterium]|nr:2-oxoglutarate dehydrogenase complex dihydrolipoyllysine-residue succinyltransferase [Chitinophagales bacterium]
MSKIIEMKVPNLAESITEVTLAQWLVEDGDYVEMDQAIVEMETDKASQELYAEQSGKIEFVAAEGEDLAIGALICRIDTSAEAPAGSTKKEETKVEDKKEPAKEEAKKETKEVPKKEESSNTSTTYAKGFPSPAAAKIAAEHEVNPAFIVGTGTGGRVTKEDVIKAIENGTATIQQGAVAMLDSGKAFSREERAERLSRLRRTISERLVYAKNSTAMLTTFNEVDMDPILAIRAKYRDTFYKKYGVGIGFMSFFTKACALALQKFPAVNARLDLDGGNIVYHDFVDVSIAVSTPKGLVVPVIRNAESLSMDGIEKEVKRLAVRGRDGELTMEEMTGGTFTITNGGIFGSLLSTPIINPPQSAILGMHKIEERPMVENGKVVVKNMMYLALSYDHRIIDGKESVSFLVQVKDYLENPEKMLLGEDPIDVLLGM